MCFSYADNHLSPVRVLICVSRRLSSQSVSQVFPLPTAIPCWDTLFHILISLKSETVSQIKTPNSLTGCLLSQYHIESEAFHDYCFLRLNREHQNNLYLEQHFNCKTQTNFLKMKSQGGERRSWVEVNQPSFHLAVTPSISLRHRHLDTHMHRCTH